MHIAQCTCTYFIITNFLSMSKSVLAICYFKLLLIQISLLGSQGGAMLFLWHFFVKYNSLKDTIKNSLNWPTDRMWANVGKRSNLTV